MNTKTLEQFQEFVITPADLVFKDLLSMKWVLLRMKLTLLSMISVCGFPGRHTGSDQYNIHTGCMWHSACLHVHLMVCNSQFMVCNSLNSTASALIPTDLLSTNSLIPCNKRNKLISC